MLDSNIKKCVYKKASRNKSLHEATQRGPALQSREVRALVRSRRRTQHARAPARGQTARRGTVSSVSIERSLPPRRQNRKAPHALNPTETKDWIIKTANESSQTFFCRRQRAKH